MSTPVLTLGPEIVSQSGERSAWEKALIDFVRQAGQSGQTVVVSTETRLLSPEEAAQRLMVSRSTISRRIADGEIRAVKVGNRHRIAYSEVQRVWHESMGAMAKVVAEDIEADLFGDE